MKIFFLTASLALVSGVFAQKSLSTAPDEKANLRRQDESKAQRRKLYKPVNVKHVVYVADQDSPSTDRQTSSFSRADIHAFPNPFNSQLDVIITDAGMDKSAYAATLHDVSGKEVFSQKLTNHQNSLELSQLAKGVYVLYITRDGVNIKQEKFVKQ